MTTHRQRHAQAFHTGDAKMKTYQFSVNGMTCGGCVGSAKRAIGKLDGIEQVDVTLQPGSATVQANPAKVTAAQIQSTLAELGFEAQLMSAGA
jgi:copper chaperone